MSRTYRIAVFASGNGSNLQAFMDRERDPAWPLKIVLVVSDRPGCKALARADAAGIATFAARPADFADKTAFEQAVLQKLQSVQADWLILAGYMRIIGSTLLEAFPNRILNIHPSLLPLFPGKQAVLDALTAGATVTGVTVHLVDAGVDTGPVIAQERIAIQAGDTEETLLERVHAVEHRLYPETARAWIVAKDS